jgi:osmotically-inducible protein OsmY
MRTSLSRLTALFVVAVCLWLSACSGPHPNRTHRGDLIDDKVTAQRVSSALAAKGEDFAQVHARASNGVVVLSGTVANAQLRARAQEIVQNLARVQKVENQLQIGH